ncbi:MAG: type III pantothenate kinase [Clostridia bacterium]|nr:type III pantothenate kinase [Clostridia bacterium]
MIIAIDIGNTNIHVGIFNSKKLLGTFYIGTDHTRSGDEYAITIKSLVQGNGFDLSATEGVIIGSVCPDITPKLQYAIKKLTSAQITIVGPGIKTGYPIKVDNPSELGADLVANTAGALDMSGSPVVIVDFGTATTISAVDKSKAYAGCYIMPGIQMSLNSLNQTGLLPNVIADESFPVLAKNSSDSMKSGVIFGQVMAVEGFVETYKRELDLPSSTPVYVTGGFAPMLLTYFRIKVKYVEDLTLKGLNVIYNSNNKKTKLK